MYRQETLDFKGRVNYLIKGRVYFFFPATGLFRLHISTRNLIKSLFRPIHSLPSWLYKNRSAKSEGLTLISSADRQPFPIAQHSFVFYKT